MNWDFPIGPGHFGASGSFMIKKMSFKRMIWRSFRVKPCNTRHEIDIPKNKVFFLISQFIWDPRNPHLFLFKDQPFVSVSSHRKFFTDE
ncbi:hypothetical protein Goshw_000396 [Gossypium schwendimanii]|uniref:Uncharacterized protein n=1 Tax=Gossypium schwendimanii TaxID=34291 RepID=A0A7J9N073_GOSSC|nr:hypothetical protein [Gossypium schwendimanii]